MEKKHIAHLVAQWKYGVPLVEDDKHSIEIIAMFDHDFEFHLLVMEYDRTLHVRGYSLWFIGVEIDASHIKSWNNQDIAPFAEAAEIVQDWLELKVAHSGSWLEE